MNFRTGPRSGTGKFSAANERTVLADRPGGQRQDHHDLRLPAPSWPNAADGHIITVEDPVEQIVPGTMQTEVNEAIGLDFARAARHLLRQDPQVLIIGEIRDEATAQLAVRAGLTGHLVISTLHAGSCRGVFERLLAMCADHSAVASAVELVLNQRLIRKVCAACDGSGCERCLQTGYCGRVPLVEWLRVDEKRANKSGGANWPRSRRANARSLGALAGERGRYE